MAHADRPVGSPRSLEGHPRRGLVALDSEFVEDVDRRTVTGVTDPITAVIGPHQSHTSLIVRGKRSPGRNLPPRLVPKPDAFALGPADAGDKKTPSQGDVLTTARERARERKAET